MASLASCHDCSNASVRETRDQGLGVSALRKQEPRRIYHEFCAVVRSFTSLATCAADTEAILSYHHIACFLLNWKRSAFPEMKRKNTRKSVVGRFVPAADAACAQTVRALTTLARKAWSLKPCTNTLRPLWSPASRIQRPRVNHFALPDGGESGSPRCLPRLRATSRSNLEFIVTSSS